MSESTDKSSATGTTATASSSKCPVQHSTTNQTVVGYSGKTSSSSSSSSSSYSLWNFWRSSTKEGNTTGREINNDSIKNFKNGNVVTSTSSSSGCPVIHNNQQSMTDSSHRNSSSATNGTFVPFVPRLATASASPPSSQEHASSHSQIPQPQQQLPLSTHRAISSIPKPCPVQSESTFTSSSVSLENKQLPSNASTSRFGTSSSNTPSIPAHQPESSEKWVYPSEQQFYNAMKRKGWELPPGIEKSIPHVVRIHNAVNERGWKEILEWERMRDPKNDNPRLVRFIGRPKDLSPRARFYSTLWLRNEPFDRHDWFVDRGDGTGERRYVIDFYNGKEDSVSSSISASNSASTSTTNNSLGLPSMYLDVRPALDDLEAVQDRVKMLFRNAFPGIAAEFTTTASTKREQDIGKMENPLASSSQGK
mmetsp:Transcript_15169/g.28518  ORF Transcript_15169/g.28518 Transcript_15169/m.28518 type:complete len:421 (+) Transcript_15169:170-1432(+)|eukprot:CAMPEP_0176488044 /NCGR_PEP_ID=MMETSP0200_2-20121128/6481_1 /TAXON_ID=947934 /ORGANISM="Chaetoceros sp., Strain GSL56" /LENGTH=420 /DNA_ID=CAMNT_0017884965 /DNA_START=1711 /DNA_END=2973 /DNA_ORIENTATION=-